MSTEIKSVSATKSQANFAQTATEELSESTKKELQALGIPTEDGMTESQAQAKIQEARMQKLQQSGAGTEVEIASDVKSLAATIGLSVEEGTPTDEILAQIAEELEAQIDEAEGNPQELSALMGYFKELSNLDAQYTDIQRGQSKLFNEMELISQNNKQEFGF